MVPKGWELLTAADICHSVSVGIVIKPSQYYVNESEGVKAFRSANVREGYINDSNWVYLSKEGHAANKKSQLQVDDILVVRTGYPGTACVVTEEFAGSNAIDIVIVRPNKDIISSSYLCAFTNSEYGKAQVLNLQGGMAQQHLNVGAYQQLKVTVPPIHEQNKIAKILFTWDKAINTTEQLLAISQQQKKALMQKLLAGNVRFEGFEGKWKFLSFDEAFKVANKKSSQILSSDYLSDGLIPIVDQGQKLIVGFSNCDDPYTDVPVIVFGDHTRCLKWIDFVFSPGADGTQVLKTTSVLTAKFGYYMLCNTEIQNLGYSRHMRELKEKEFYIPVDLKEQEKVVETLSSFDREIEMQQQSLECLRQEKKALMQQLLTGKRRVNVEAI